MTLRVAVQMDPLETININGDSTFHLMLAAQARGYELWYYDVRRWRSIPPTKAKNASPAGPRRSPYSASRVHIFSAATTCCSTWARISTSS
jgi:glutathione synthase/RimK-type ligase-like ATP-grasp enzyme